MTWLLLAACGSTSAWFGGTTPLLHPEHPDLRVHPDTPTLPTELLCEGSLSITCFEPIGGGRFPMGAQATDPSAPNYDPAATPHEGPVHDVTVAPFWIHRFEASVQYVDRCIAAGACDEAHFASGGALFNRGWEERRDYAINGVTWEGARQYCAWIGGRLPTESEWELAARGPDGRRYPWGNDPACGTVRAGIRTDWSEQMETGPCRNLGVRIHRDLRGHSPFHIEGMAGNVWEWTADWFSPDAYATAEKRNPTGPATGDRRVQRGGGWMEEDPVDLRTTNRIGVDPTARLPDVGFRCVWTPK
jgi:iron(II)-dependent oxidoreductase